MECIFVEVTKTNGNIVCKLELFDKEELAKMMPSLLGMYANVDTTISVRVKKV